MQGKAKGVELCKEAVKYARTQGKGEFIDGDATTYQDKEKYDAVCACEVIEHIPDPAKLIKNMLSLVSDGGWCYLTTPNGCFDSESTMKVWESEDALFDHVRTYNKQKILELLGGCEVGVVESGKELFVKFKFDLARAVEELMENNQALKAWDLVKDTDSPLKERVWLRVKHAFDNKAYKDYYENGLIEIPVSEDMALDCTKLAPRFAWVVPKIVELKPKEVADLGCADGYLCLTLANKKIKSIGYNLYEPSIKLANKRAEKFKIPATFAYNDIFNVQRKADVVVMMEVLEHLPDPQKGVDHAMKLLNEGGTAFFSTPSPDDLGIVQHKAEPNHEGWNDGKPSGHLRIFTEEEFRNLFKSYEIVEFFKDAEGCMNMGVRRNE
jgi:2-polyprenyl-3-methyl-5-hydroxy-6-metoxy-1,4-benzoquinol methylase